MAHNRRTANLIDKLFDLPKIPANVVINRMEMEAAIRIEPMNKGLQSLKTFFPDPFCDTYRTNDECLIYTAGGFCALAEVDPKSMEMRWREYLSDKTQENPGVINFFPYQIYGNCRKLKPFTRGQRFEASCY